MLVLAVFMLVLIWVMLLSLKWHHVSSELGHVSSNKVRLVLLHLTLVLIGGMLVLGSSWGHNSSNGVSVC